MHSASLNGSRLQHQQQNGKRGEQWVPVQEHQSGNNSTAVHEARKIFANTIVAERNSAAHSNESLSVPVPSPATTTSPVAAATLSPVDSAVAAALAPADAGGGGSGLNGGRTSGRSSLVASPAADGRVACDSSNSPSPVKPLQVPAAALGETTLVPKSEKTGRKVLPTTGGEGRPTLAKRTTSTSVFRRNKEPLHVGSDNAKIAAGTIKKKESLSSSPESGKKSKESGIPATTNVLNKTKDSTATAHGTKADDTLIKRRESYVLGGPSRPESGISSRRSTGESLDTHPKKLLSSRVEMQQHKQQQEKNQQKQQVVGQLPKPQEQNSLSQQHKEKQHRQIRGWGDRTEEKEILKAFPDLMGAELLHGLPSSLQQQTGQQQQIAKGKQQQHYAINEGVCLFRLWGPHVEKCWVHIKDEIEGEAKAKEENLFEMLNEGEEKWGTVLRGVQHGTPYEFVLQSSWNDCFATEGYHLHRRDPYARQVDFSSTTCFVIDPSSYKWKSPAPSVVPWNRLVIYELHPGSFVNDKEEKEKTVFQKLIEKLDYIKRMHFTAVELLPIQEFGGEWGYNPRLLMAPHGKYGTVQQLQQFVDECHKRNLAVIFDVVLNHGSSKLNSLWNWDGYGKDNNGGIYFEGGGDTGWGRKFAFHKKPVRQMIMHAAALFLQEYKVDGLRMDSVHNMPWDLLQEMTRALDERFPERILIAEITPETPKVCEGGAGFNSCWIHSTYYDAIKIIRGEESPHHMDMLRAMIDIHKGFSKSHQCVNSILGSHDQAGNKQQVSLPEDVSSTCLYICTQTQAAGEVLLLPLPLCWYSLQATSRGLPMLFMGTETCQDEWWNIDAPHCFKWQLVEDADVISQQMRNLVTTVNELRLKHVALTNDDASAHFPHVDSTNRVLGFTRGNLLVVLNFSENQWDEASYQVNTDWRNKIFYQRFNSQAAAFGGWDGSWTVKDDAQLHSSATGQLAVKLPKWSVAVYEMSEQAVRR